MARKCPRLKDFCKFKFISDGQGQKDFTGWSKIFKWTFSPSLYSSRFWVSVINMAYETIFPSSWSYVIPEALWLQNTYLGYELCQRNAFGRLKARWHHLAKQNDKQILNVSNVITASCNTCESSWQGVWWAMDWTMQQTM